jgi:hypothetical protein
MEPEAKPILETKRDANGDPVCPKCDKPIHANQHTALSNGSMVHVECLSTK